MSPLTYMENMARLAADSAAYRTAQRMGDKLDGILKAHGYDTTISDSTSAGREAIAAGRKAEGGS